MKLKSIRQDFLRFLGNHFLYFAVSVLCKSLKFNYTNKNVVEDLESQKKNFVLAFWHGSMLLPWYLFKNKNFAALTSKSKDGDLLARILKQWNYEVVRGSSSKGGDVALGIMVDYAKNKSSIAITPDGPKGPPHQFKAGAVITAKRSSLPVVLVAVGVKRKRNLNSWDKFEVPKLFSSVNILFSEPIYVDEKLSHDEVSRVIKDCEAKLNEMSSKANLF